MALTALEVSKSKATDKPQRLADGGNMYLLIQPNGAKYWRMDYRLAGKRKTLAIGVYPDMSLSDVPIKIIRDGREKHLLMTIEQRP